MIVKLISGEEYEISFQHDPEANQRINGKTICSIIDLASNFVVGQATAICVKPDVFSRAIGRRVSLTKVLSYPAWPRKIRTEFWKTYFSYCRDLK